MGGLLRVPLIELVYIKTNQAGIAPERIIAMRSRVIKAIEENKLIVICRGIPAHMLIPTGEALYRGGVRLLEITYSPDGRVSDEETAETIRLLAKHFEGLMDVGAGTVLTKQQVQLTAEAGGKFIISPDAVPEIIAESKRLGLVSIPGALTPSEITAAHRAGADFVKLFPAGAMGLPYFKAVKAPLSHIRLLAVGGIEADAAGAYLEAGAAGFGLSSSILKKTLLDRKDYSGITEAARKYVTVIEKSSQFAAGTQKK